MTVAPSVVLKEFGASIALVLGSGLGGLADRLEIEYSIPYSDIVGLPVSRVPGHAGRFLAAHLAGVRVLVAQGRVHLYEGLSAREVTASVRFLASHGISQLLLTNAAGSANPEFAPGDWMLIRDHINATGVSPLTGGPHFLDLTQVYSARLRGIVHAAAKKQTMRLHEGVYFAVPGPQYETPAEVTAYRRLGADAIGMSTVLEAIEARAHGMEVTGLSCLTNWAAGMGEGVLSHSEVVETGRGAAEGLCAMLTTALPEF